MEKNTLKILLATTLIAVGAGTAIAQDRGGPRMSFEELDVDGSGEITAEDLTALRDNRFSDLDANGDGSVNLDEFKAAQVARAEERATEMFERLDADGDGVLSRDVLERGRGDARGIRMIERFDADNSGGVSAEEFEEARAMMRERGGRGEGRERGFGKRHN
ncbi:MAG: calcium-binding protein [Silicimonas sp.]|jgi:Ca2+-binding EF-hand superfamily protein|nr:calcium-binding protein [Silicimonas sp.]